MLLGGGLVWATSAPVTESLSRPAIAASGSIEARGAAAFAGAGFGGISTDASPASAF